MSASSYPQVKPFTYVRIPCDEAAPVAEERFTGNGETELREVLTRHFRQGLLSSEQKAQMAQHLVAKSKEQLEKNAARREGADAKAPEIDPVQQQQLIDTYLDQASYEIVPITMPMRNTNFIGTSLYIDDSGAFKDLPMNTRASVIARRDIRGDAFLLSNHDDPALDEWGRVDCDIAAYEKLRANPPSNGYDTSNQAQMAKAAMLRENDTKKITAEDAEKAVKSREDGNRFFSAGDTKAAVQAYSLAIELTEGRRDLLPNEAELTAVYTAALLNRSLCLCREGKYADAAKDAQRVLLLDEANAKAYYRLAQANIHLQEYEHARAAVDRFVACGGSQQDATAMLATIVDGEKKFKDAEKKRFSKMFS